MSPEDEKRQATSHHNSKAKPEQPEKSMTTATREYANSRLPGWSWWNLSPAAFALSNPRTDLTIYFEDLHVYLMENPRI